MTARLRLFGVALAVVALSGRTPAQQMPPRFQTAVDLTTVDAVVIDDRGQPVTDLQPTDFVVRVDNAPRRVVTAEWVPLAASSTAPAAKAETPPEGYTSNQTSTGG